VIFDQFISLWIENKQLRDLLFVAVVFLVAWIVHAVFGRMIEQLVAVNRFAADGRRLRPERIRTLRGLIANAFSLVVFLIALFLAASRFVDSNTLLWVIGLFSAAFGLGARPLVNDFLNGISFIFEDTFDVGEKVEIMGVEGVIERVTLRVTLLRAPTGELFVVPNGDIRLVRNFSRGRFSSVTVTIKIQAEELGHALTLLNDLGQEAVVLLPNLLEPWQVLSESGAIGGSTELTLVGKARFGAAAEMRPRLLALVQERMVEAGIQLAD
jgi:small conductance mechanosensitive channel